VVSIAVVAAERLSPLDTAFLEVETPTSHMHVGFRARFEVPEGGRPITIERVRALVASRLGAHPRFRQRLAFTPGGFGPPAWVDAAGFRVADHVRLLTAGDEPIERRRFDGLVDAALSTPLDRRRPLWEVHVAPQIDDGTVGLVMKAHHAMVDGLSAVVLAMLLLDADPQAAEPPSPAPAWAPSPAPGGTRLAAGAIADAGAESLRTAGRLARMATPDGVRGLADTLRRTALAVEHDVLRAAPESSLNTAIGPRRQLTGYTCEIERVLAVKEAHGVTLNDVVLAVAAGALRELALARGTLPAPIKAMVPVARRAPEEAAALGNRIAFVGVPLPLQVRNAASRLRAVHEATRAFKEEGRPAGGETLIGALGLLPGPIRGHAARLAASPRAYNLVVSNVPGPRIPVHFLGARAIEAFPVIPLAARHTLSIGALSLHDRLCFGVHADPESLPEAVDLPGALSASVVELERTSRRRRAA
jgi:WS/DGAT/MGAT family acyltransferase